MAATLREAPCRYLSFDEARTIRDANEAGAALLGRPREALLGAPLATILPPGARVFVEAHLLPLLALPGRRALRLAARGQRPAGARPP